MPAKKPIPEEISEEQVLAAIDRARRHQRNQDSPGVLRATIKDHLGLSRDGGSTVRLRPTWDALHDAGEIEYTREPPGASMGQRPNLESMPVACKTGREHRAAGRGSAASLLARSPATRRRADGAPARGTARLPRDSERAAGADAA